MINIKVEVNGKVIIARGGVTILEAAREEGFYVPVLCDHVDLPAFHSAKRSDYIYQGTNKISDESNKTVSSVNGCGLCLVSIGGNDDAVASCRTVVEDGMVIQTENDSIRRLRQKNLSRILTNHPHACLTCDMREGCSRIECPYNVPLNERCCSLLGNCELQNVAEYIGISPETPKYHYVDLPRIADDPLIFRDFNLCISCGRCVRVCQGVKGVYALSAVVNGGILMVGTVNGPSLEEAECSFCSSCVEVCPTGAIIDKNNSNQHDKKTLVPCRAACPGEVNIPLYLRLITEGQFQEAGEVITSKLPFASVLGKVCFHPCETDCRRGEVSDKFYNSKEPARIRMLKDFAMSRYIQPDSLPKSPETGKKVAVVGSGPAGLTAAYFLSLNGHDVTVYEENEKIGGMLRYGIPSFRLSGKALHADIQLIMKAGMKIRTNTALGRDISISTLMKNGCDAVFLAVGLSKGKQMKLPGTDCSGIIDGVRFLSEVSNGKANHNEYESKNIVVIGGGNVAIDAARSAVRLKAKTVTLVCLEKRPEMPAYTEEILLAEEENIEILNGWGIEEIDTVLNRKKAGKNGRSLKIQMKKCISVFDKSGIFKPEYSGTEKSSIISDLIIVCIGQEIDSVLIKDENDLAVSEKGTIYVKSGTLSTNIKGVFAGGDSVSGPSSVINAVGAGRRAAREIDLFLGGSGKIYMDDEKEQTGAYFAGRNKGFLQKRRAPVSFRDPVKRIKDFGVVEYSFSEKTSLLEASRCLKCDLRTQFNSNPLPPEKDLKFDREVIETIPAKEGVVQLMDEKRNITAIKGSENIRDTMFEYYSKGENAEYFKYDLDPMFTQRETELIQKHIRKYGTMSSGFGDLDDLF